MPEALGERARVWRWLFFEQNLFEPNVGTARFWRLTGRETLKPEVFAARLDSARAALDTLDRGLAGRRFLLGEVYTVADVSLYAYAHVAGDAGIDMGEYGEVGAWLRRVEATPGFVNDLEPYPPGATAARAAHPCTADLEERPAGAYFRGEWHERSDPFLVFQEEAIGWRDEPAPEPRRPPRPRRPPPRTLAGDLARLQRRLSADSAGPAPPRRGDRAAPHGARLSRSGATAAFCARSGG